MPRSFSYSFFSLKILNCSEKIRYLSAVANIDNWLMSRGNFPILSSTFWANLEFKEAVTRNVKLLPSIDIIDSRMTPFYREIQMLDLG